MGQSGVTYQLSQTTLEQALIFIGKWVDDRGLRINVMAKTLFVPTELQFTADKILKTEYEVNTANNTINPVKGKLKPVVSPFLTDTDAWFILTDVTESQNDGFISYQRRKAEMERDNEFMTQNLSFQGSMRFSAGCTDWRGAWGSSGA
jgi:phage major head subunit gpT-like protein